jgi:hypothetical protein
MRKIELSPELFDEVLGERERGIETPLEGGLALLADEGIRIFTLGKEQETDFPPFASFGERILKRTPRCGTSGPVAVEGEYNFVYQLKDTAQMLRRSGGSERRHAIRHSELMEPHGIHVAFHHEKPPELRAALADLEEPIKLPTLVKEHGLG